MQWFKNVFYLMVLCTFSFGGDFLAVQELLPYSKEHAGERFGSSIAMSGDFAVVGARTYNSNRGTAYVYHFENNAWVRVAQLNPTDPVNVGYFGTAVAMQGDTILVTATRESSGIQSKVYMFVKPTAGWVDTTETTLLPIVSRKQDTFGGTMSWSGEDLVIGTRTSRVKSGDGMAYVFKRVAGEFVLTDSIMPPSPIFLGNFGTSVAIDGDIMAIGEPAYNTPGKVYVYKRSSGVWSLAETLQSSLPHNADDFGSSVIVKNGVVAASSPYLANYRYGGIFVFEEVAGTWTQKARLTFTGNGNQLAGYMGREAHSINFEDDNIIAGIPGYYFTYPEKNVGTLVAFNKPSSGWVNDSIGVELASTTQIEEDNYGWAISSANGRVLASSIDNDFQGSQTGIVRYYKKPTSGLWIDAFENQSFQSLTGHQLGFKIKIQGNIAIASAIKYNEGKGAVNVYEHNGTKWAFKAQLTASDGFPEQLFGRSIALDQNTIVVGAPGDTTNGLQNSGAIYIYEKTGANWMSGTESYKLYEHQPLVNYEFGTAVDVKNNQIVASAPNAIGQSGYSGYVKLITNTGNDWSTATHEKVFSNLNKLYDFMGVSIALDDSLLFVGGVECNLGGTDNGCVDVLKNIDGTWTTVNRLTADTTFTDQKFGYSLDYEDGVLVVGAYADKVAGVATGKAYVFENTVLDDFSTMHQVAKLTGSNASNSDRLGLEVGISGDVIISGAYSDDDQANNSGAAYIYRKPNGGWKDTTENQKIIPTNASSNSLMGYGVAVYKGYAMVGGHGHNNPSDNMGLIQTYSLAIPATQAKFLTAISVGYDSISLAWTEGNGDSVLVMAQSITSGNPILENGTSYNANDTLGLGDFAGNGWYVVYKGPSQSDTITVKGLTYNKSYKFKVYEYSDVGGVLMYNQNTAANNPLTQKTTGQSLTSVAINVSEKIMINTTTNLEYNIGNGWFDCTADTTFNLDFIEGDVLVRNIGNVGGERIVKTLVRPVAPIYTIDYINEQTSQNIATSVEYNYDDDFNSINEVGTGVKIDLTPGTNIYFRNKATNKLLASHIDTLEIPDRPTAPNFSIDFENQTTGEHISSDYSISMNNDMSDATLGDGSVYTLTPGQNVFFQKMASANSFLSEIQELIIPQIPINSVFSIDYLNESTNEIVDPKITYFLSNSDSLNQIQGEGAVLTLTPSVDVIFKVQFTDSSFSSSWDTLEVTNRPVFVGLSDIDYINEMTTNIVDSNVLYSIHSDMTEARSGVDSTIALTPGQNLYFQNKATATSFKSEIMELEVDPRPINDLNLSINFIDEITNEAIPNAYFYSVNSDLSDSVVGGGLELSIEPGQNIYFQKIASSISFASGVGSLSVPARPAAPEFSIDFGNESTAEIIPSDVMYSENSDMSLGTVGSDAVLDLLPNTNVYFQSPASASSFTSSVFSLTIPSRPSAPLNGQVDDELDTFKWDYLTGYEDVTEYECSMDEGVSWSTCLGNPWYVGDGEYSIGQIHVRLQVGEMHFVGEEIASLSEFTLQDLPVNHEYDLSVHQVFKIREGILTLGSKNHRILLFNHKGQKQKMLKLNEGRFGLNHLAPGSYLLQLVENKKSKIYRIKITH